MQMGVNKCYTSKKKLIGKRKGEGGKGVMRKREKEEERIRKEKGNQGSRDMN